MTDNIERIATLEAKMGLMEKQMEHMNETLTEVRDALLQAKGVKATLLILGAFFGFWFTKAIALIPFVKGG